MQKIAGLEKAAIQQVLPSLFGYHLLQLGPYKDLSWLQSSRISHQFRLCSESLAPTQDSWLQADYDALPLANSSVDVVVAPYVLADCLQPQAVLAEIQRVLLPEGNLLVLGFNPWHPWCWFNLPRKQKYLSLGKMKSLAKAFDFSIVEIKRLHFSAGYLIHLQKEVMGVTPIRPRWEKKLVAKEFWQPTARKTNAMYEGKTNENH